MSVSKLSLSCHLCMYIITYVLDSLTYKNKKFVFHHLLFVVIYPPVTLDFQRRFDKERYETCFFFVVRLYNDYKPHSLTHSKELIQQIVNTKLTNQCFVICINCHQVLKQIFLIY